MGKELCLWLIRYTLLYTVQPAHYFLFSSLHQTIAKPTSSSLKVEKQREKKKLSEHSRLQGFGPFFSIIDGLWHRYLAYYSFLLTDQ